MAHFMDKTNRIPERNFWNFAAFTEKKFDVGIMQVNLHWNGSRVSSYEDLLDQEKNIMTGAEVLAEAIESSPGDLELGIGRYHNWDDEDRARNYGSRILAIWRNIGDLGNKWILT